MVRLRNQQPVERVFVMEREAIERQDVRALMTSVEAAE